MNTRTIILTTAAVILTLGGCGGSGTATSSTPTPAASPSATDVAALATQAGCETYKPSAASELELFVAEGGTCTLANGHTVTVRRFVDANAQTQFWAAAKSFGADPAMAAAVGLVSFQPDESADLAVIRAVLAGSPALSVSPSPSASEDVDGFLQGWADYHGDAGEATDDLVDLGRTVCTKLDDGATPEDVMSALTDSLDSDQASTLLAAAVSYLCPEHRDEVSN